MAFPQPFLDALIDRNPIDEVVGQYVSLTRRGSNLFGLCPFHSEKTASFSVAPDKGIYYCFGCHAGGGVVNFIMQIEGLDFPDAVRFLAKRAGMEVPEDEAYHSQYQKQERLWALCKDAARFFRQQLFSPVGKPAQAYIQKRALSMDTVKRFGLGFSPDAWATLTDTMKEKGYRLDELIDAGLSIRGKNGGVYDRFRNRLMFLTARAQHDVCRTVMHGNSIQRHQKSACFHGNRSVYGACIQKRADRLCKFKQINYLAIVNRRFKRRSGKQLVRHPLKLNCVLCACKRAQRLVLPRQEGNMPTVGVYEAVKQVLRAAPRHVRCIFQGI